MNGLVLFIKNLCYLTKFSLKSRLLSCFPEITYDEMVADILYKIPLDIIKRPIICSKTDTIRSLYRGGGGLSRFGDGEIQIIEGFGIPFQEYDEVLSRRLREILTGEQKNLRVAINNSYFNNIDVIKSQSNEVSRRFSFYSIPLFRRKLLKYIDYNKTYYDSEITGVDKTNKEEAEIYFSLVRKIWDNKKVLIVCCENAFKSLKYNIFDNACKQDVLYIPNKNAFRVYQKTLDVMKTYDKDTIIILMAGPTASVWASDLTSLGYCALDLGHLAKSYDHFKRDIPVSGQNIKSFFAPD